MPSGPKEYANGKSSAEDFLSSMSLKQRHSKLNLPDEYGRVLDKRYFAEIFDREQGLVHLSIVSSFQIEMVIAAICEQYPDADDIHVYGVDKEVVI